MGLVHFEDGKVLYYPYTPSTPAGYAFVALFAIATIAHITYVCKYKAKFFIPIVLGGICETFGYYGRAWAGSRPNSPKPFMLQLMLILIAPVFICATIYMTLGKFKQNLLGKPKRKCGLTSLFVLVDIAAFCSQVGGGLVQVTGNLDVMRIGDSVVLGGLVFQLVALAIYFGLIVSFHRMACRDLPHLEGWKPFVWVLAISVLATWVRNLVRVIEYAQGFHGFISENEAMLYIFDAVLMLLVIILLLAFHPSRLLQKKGKDGSAYTMDYINVDNL